MANSFQIYVKLDQLGTPGVVQPGSRPQAKAPEPQMCTPASKTDNRDNDLTTRYQSVLNLILQSFQVDTRVRESFVPLWLPRQKILKLVLKF